MEMKVICTGEKPSYANEYAAGLDLRSNNRVLMQPGDIFDIDTQLSIELPPGYFGMVVARSGLSFKHQIKLINDIGIIDEDYKNEIGVRLVNEGKEAYQIEKGDRIAQLIITPYIQPQIIYVDKLSPTNRKGGFGSTGR